jgi:hypothetical protein
VRPEQGRRHVAADVAAALFQVLRTTPPGTVLSLL